MRWVVSHARAGRRRQFGVALITALLAASLASIVAVEMARRQQLDIRRTANLLNRDQAYLYLLGAEAWAIGVLVKDAKDGDRDGEWEDWARELPPIAVEGGAVMGKIVDMQARFNINNLWAGWGDIKIDQERFERLLDILKLDPELVNAVIDWLDEDIDPKDSLGAEDDFYQRFDPPYRSANAKMVSVSELRRVRGFTAEAYDRLHPFVYALPERTDINVNTAALETLRSLADDLSETQAQELIDARGEEGFKSIDDFVQLDPLAGVKGFSPEQLAVGSDFFLLASDAQIGQAPVHLSSLLRRDAESVRTVMRSQGEL